MLIKIILSCCLILIIFLTNSEAQAGELAERLANFPQWQKLTSVKPAVGDLIYPEWMAGTWKVTSTLVDLAAPLAPDVVTPGFEGNRLQLNQPVSFLVRFVKVKPPIFQLKLIPKIDNSSKILVADRVFNSLNLSRAYLGDDTVLAVKLDPETPNRQITFFRGKRQLISVVTARATEKSNNQFITTEVFQQYFKGGSRAYFNNVESTTAYHQLLASNPAIAADQVTAVYLSPQDPDYFTAGSQPVALYRYRLEFFPSAQPNP